MLPLHLRLRSLFVGLFLERIDIRIHLDQSLRLRILLILSRLELENWLQSYAPMGSRK